jgi:GGDEF domain-containing protein
LYAHVSRVLLRGGIRDKSAHRIFRVSKPEQPRDDDTLTATAALRADHVRTSRLRLLVVGEGVYATYPLPEQGDLIIGRSNKADICIDDPAISRRHAVLHVRMPPIPANPRDSAIFEPLLHIEDLGSANGVRVRDQKLTAMQTVDVYVGDTIDLGSTSLIVQRSPMSARLRRLWSHGAFEARLEDECARAERSGAPFSVMRIHVEGVLPPVAVQETLGQELRSIDVIATYGPNEYEALLIDAAPAKADEMASRVTSGLTRLGASVLVGIASYPKDGRAPEELIAKACAAVRDNEEEAPSGPPVVVPRRHDAEALQAREAHRVELDQRAHPRRDGRRQGGLAEMPAQGVSARAEGAPPPQLRGPLERAPGERALRPRARRLHRRRHREARPARDRARRHRIPRRGRRAAALHAGEAPPRPGATGRCSASAA